MDIVESSEQETEPKEIENLEEDKKHNFKPGQVLRFIRVRFPGHAKSFPFLIGKRHYSYGQKVVALSDRGMAVGYINSFPYEAEFREEMLPVKTISKVASEQDNFKQDESLSKEKEMEDLCKDLIRKHELAMNVTHVELTAYGKKAVFYFTAPERVDFRSLVKDLVSNLKMRIELRQISARERSAALGGLGPCGREFCCSSFLTRYGNVNIKMAKTQNLTLTPSKLNGLCGQLKCCTAYEEEVYKEKRTRLPQEGEFIQVLNGDTGKVTSLNIIIEQFDMLTDQGIFRRYSANQFDPKKSRPKDGWRFPERFQNISSERDKVIGLEEAQSNISPEFFDDYDSYEDQPSTQERRPHQKKVENRHPRPQRQENDRPVDQKKKESTHRNNPFKNKRPRKNKDRSDSSK